MEGTTGTALERQSPNAPAALITDDEMRRMMGIAETVAKSKSIKGAHTPDIAFAKMLVGRDFGMSPAQALLGLHFVDGSVQVHYSMLGRFVKARADEGYDYRSGWLKNEPGAKIPNQPDEPDKRVAVWIDEDDPTDDRIIVGAFVEFKGLGGKVCGTSTFTFEDAKKAGLIKQGLSEKAAWSTSRRNMYLARAMSNGVKWIVPEVMGGLPIYVEGEIVAADDRSVTAPVGDGSDDGTGKDLGPEVEAVIERAKTLGHGQLANRAAVEMQLGRAGVDLALWLRDATAELNRYEEENVLDPEPLPDVDIVPEPDHRDTVLRNRLQKLQELRGEEQDPEKRGLLDEEIAIVEGEIG